MPALLDLQRPLLDAIVSGDASGLDSAALATA